MRSRTWLLLLLFPLTGFALAEFLVSVVLSDADSQRYLSNWLALENFAQFLGVIFGGVVASLYVAATMSHNRLVRELKQRFPDALVLTVRLADGLVRPPDVAWPDAAVAIHLMQTSRAVLVIDSDGVMLCPDSHRREPFVTLPWDTVTSVSSEMHPVVVTSLPFGNDTTLLAVLRLVVVVDGTPLDLPFSVARDRRGNGEPNPLDQWALRPIVAEIVARRAAASGGC